MTYADAKKGETVGGFKCIGQIKNGLWAAFKPDNASEWTEQQQLEWRCENQRRQQQKVKEDDQRRRRSLSAQERDRQYRALLAELTLHPDDRADLVRRGFTYQQIELSGFKSVESYQKLQSQFSELLPGIGTGGKNLIVKNEGYLCPVRNVDGLIVAWQIRLRALPTGESNRYRWLSRKEQTLHLYTTGFNPDAELPLAVHRPTGKPQGIVLVEGTGSKPLLTSQRQNLLVIGAAGGQFLSSKSILKASLDKLSSELGGVKEVIIPPDGGDILNKQVMSRWQQVTVLLQEWGWSVKFAWWNQFDKTCPDIDELQDFSCISYITPDEFFKLSDPAPKQEQPQPQQEPAWKQRAKAEWRKNRSFNNAIQTASQWCEWDKPGANTIGFYKGGLGRGKTTRLKSWVKEWRESVEDVGFICLGYRNTLLLQLCEQLGFYHLHDKEAPLMKSDPNAGIALCVDSLWRFNPEDFDDKIIILDELKSVIKHLLHSPTVKNRDKILNLFDEAIRRSRQVICLDGLMADWCVDYLKTIAPDKVIIKAENTYQGKKPLINLLLGTIDAFDEKKRVKVDDRSPWFRYLLDESAVPVVCSDSQALIEALDNIFTERGLDVLRIDSKTVPEDYVKDFLKDCNAYIEKRKPDVLLYTPSAESGVDVSIPDYFTQHFGFFFGVLDVDGILQMLGRIRDDITKFVWCKSFVSESEKQHSKSPFADVIEKSINELLITDISTSITDPEAWKEKVLNHLNTVVSNSLKDVSNRVSCLVQSVQNFEKSNLRECLKEALLESGYRVRGCTLETSEEHKGKLKKETEAVKRRNASDIFNAEKVAPELVDELKFDARWEERCKVIQAKLRERLPGIDETPVWTEDFIYHIRYEDRDFISHQEMYWLFKHPEVAKRQSQKNLHWMARRLNTFVGNIKSRWAKINALHEMGFEKFLEPSAEWSNDTPEVLELVEQGKSHSNALGIHPGQQSNIRYLGSLLKMLGMKLKCTRKEGKDKRFYQLDQEGLTDPTRLKVLDCIETRFTQPEENLDWDSAINEAHGIMPENDPLAQSGQASQPPARTPKILYRNEGSPASRNLALESQGDREVLEAAAGQKSEVENGATPESRGERSLLARLTESLEYCRTPKDLFLVLEGLDATLEQVEDAIALQPTAPQRQQLTQWWLELSQHTGIETAAAAVLMGAPVQKSELEQLIEALPFAETSEDFASIVEGSPLEAVEDAISLQPDQPRRRQLREWLEAVGESTFATHLPQNDGEPVRVGQRVWAWIGAFRRWGRGVVSAILPGVSWDVRLEGEALDLVKIYCRSEIEPLGMSG
jgi:hypothetical protein